MMAPSGVRSYVAQGILQSLTRRHGLQIGWQAVRLLWLSGALDGMRAPLGEGRWPSLSAIERLAGGCCLIDPDEPHQGPGRSWPR
jgi:hypothetical protein